MSRDHRRSYFGGFCWLVILSSWTSHHCHGFLGHQSHWASFRFKQQFYPTGLLKAIEPRSSNEVVDMREETINLCSQQPHSLVEFISPDTKLRRVGFMLDNSFSDNISNQFESVDVVTKEGHMNVSIYDITYHMNLAGIPEDYWLGNNSMDLKSIYSKIDEVENYALKLENCGNEKILLQMWQYFSNKSSTNKSQTMAAEQHQISAFVKYLNEIKVFDDRISPIIQDYSTYRMLSSPQGQCFFAGLPLLWNKEKQKLMSKHGKVTEELVGNKTGQIFQAYSLSEMQRHNSQSEQLWMMVVNMLHERIKHKAKPNFQTLFDEIIFYNISSSVLSSFLQKDKSKSFMHSNSKSNLEISTLNLTSLKDSSNFCQLLNRLDSMVSTATRDMLMVALHYDPINTKSILEKNNILGKNKTVEFFQKRMRASLFGYSSKFLEEGYLAQLLDLLNLNKTSSSLIPFTSFYQEEDDISYQCYNILVRLGILSRYENLALKRNQNMLHNFQLSNSFAEAFALEKAKNPPKDPFSSDDQKAINKRGNMVERSVNVGIVADNDVGSKSVPSLSSSERETTSPFLRQDLSHLTCYAIDSSTTFEVDDCISVEILSPLPPYPSAAAPLIRNKWYPASQSDNIRTKKPPPSHMSNRTRYWIHVSDLSRWIQSDQEYLGRLAKDRVSSLYSPLGTIPMLPPCLVCDTASFMPSSSSHDNNERVDLFDEKQKIPLHLYRDPLSLQQDNKVKDTSDGIEKATTYSKNSELSPSKESHVAFEDGEIRKHTRGVSTLSSESENESRRKGSTSDLIPALSVGVELDGDGMVIRESVIVCTSTIKPPIKLTYDAFDTELSKTRQDFKTHKNVQGVVKKSSIFKLWDCAVKRFKWRSKRSFAVYRQPPFSKITVSKKSKLKVDTSIGINHFKNNNPLNNDGKDENDVNDDDDDDIVVKVTASDSKSSFMVSEFMILAGEAVGCFASKNKIPLPFRCNEKPHRFDKSYIESAAQEAERLNTLHPLCKSQFLKHFVPKTTISGSAGYHFGLGVDQYVQFTSPLRRFSDMVVHWQLKHWLLNKHFEWSMKQKVKNNLNTHTNKIDKNVGSATAAAARSTVFNNWEVNQSKEERPTEEQLSGFFNPFSYYDSQEIENMAKQVEPELKLISRVQSDFDQFWIYEYLRRCANFGSGGGGDDTANIGINEENSVQDEKPATTINNKNSDENRIAYPKHFRGLILGNVMSHVGGLSKVKGDTPQIIAKRILLKELGFELSIPIDQLRVASTATATAAAFTGTDGMVVPRMNQNENQTYGGKVFSRLGDLTVGDEVELRIIHSHPRSKTATFEIVGERDGERE